MCTVSKVGLISMGAGALTSVIGIGFIFSNDGSGSRSVNGEQGNVGAAMTIGGAIIVGIGGCLALGGGVHDFIKLHKKRVSLVSPGTNQVGLALNF